ncbi:MAG: Inner membrane protein YohD [Candidatus Dichloromethanomonas elyunquensis]|nr:MAG: Inner membrane protein YohD [Candidatus Dichloromethanomonas elyunquensis]
MEYQLAHLLKQYGYIGIILALSGGMVGFPFPDEILMTFAGYQVTKGNMVYSLAIASAFFGASVGISASYLLGYKLGLPFLKKYGPRFNITEQKIEKAHELFLRYGSIWIVAGYFIPGVRHINGYLAGIANMGLRKFGGFAFSGALLWSITFITLGYNLGEQWYIIRRIMTNYWKYGFACLIILGVMGVLIYFLLKDNSKKNNDEN